MAKITQKDKKGSVVNDREHRNILGVKVDSTSTASVLRFVRSSVLGRKVFYIVTPNPEIVMQAQKDPDLKKILNSADVSLPDGIGLAQAQKFLSLPSEPKASMGRWPTSKGAVRRFLTLFVQGLAVGFLTVVDNKKITEGFEIISGRKMFLELIKLANRKKWRVFLLGGEGGEAVGTKSELEKTYKAVVIKAQAGPMLNFEGEPIAKKDEKSENNVIGEINNFNPHLLFVAFKFPRQEKWVYRWYKELNIGGAMVVGGTFNYISGKAKLPPKWFEDRGLEWIWRLATSNQKPRRIITAFPTFPLRVFWEKLSQ